MRKTDLPEVISLPEAILLAGPGLGKTRSYELAKLGMFPGQLPTVRGRYRINRAALLEALADGWTEDEKDGAA